MTDYINGIVKWFDTKKGFGFIKACDSDVEYFIHHARLTTDLQFSTLFDGEYVSFCVVSENGKQMADDVKGISRGPLLCESRKIKKDYRLNKSSDGNVDESISNTEQEPVAPDHQEPDAHEPVES